MRPISLFSPSPRRLPQRWSGMVAGLPAAVTPPPAARPTRAWRVSSRRRRPCSARRPPPPPPPARPISRSRLRAPALPAHGAEVGWIGGGKGLGRAGRAPATREWA
eukprot:gene2990-biopygen12655